MSAFTVSQVLFPTDYSDVSRAAGHMAADLARRFNARLHVIHVVPPVTDPGPPESLPSALADLGPGLDAVTALVFGRPAREIVSYAWRHGIDVIVMGTHGRTGVSRALLGSVAEAVARHASCPVLTVPATTEEDTRERKPRIVNEACVACGAPSEDLICEGCRAAIRGDTALGGRGSHRG
jgi:nucleotide-binding universal stress UspA family protein